MTAPTSKLYLEAPRRLRALVRARESSLIVLAAIVGAMGGLFVALMSKAVGLLHEVFFNIPHGERLSSQAVLDPMRAVLVPTIGGLLFGLSLLILHRWRPGREVDPIEANALHGGKMSFRGSIIVALQTIWSSGVGASVGTEAGYTQISSGLASVLGRAFHLLRSDQRILVGCGCAAAIAGAFGAPLAVAFYGFELIISGYTPASLAPIGVAAMTGFAVAHHLAPTVPGIILSQVGTVTSEDIAIAVAGGFLCALAGCAVMRAVAIWDTVMARSRLWVPLRVAIGGLLVGLFALKTPQIMSSGHGALHTTNVVTLPVLTAVIVSTQVTRELFGYSFATWRFHLRGETIRSSAYIGWIRDLTVASMMRGDVTTIPLDMPIGTFCQRYPLGSKTQVIAVDAEQKYAGIIFAADAHAPPDDAPAEKVGDITRYQGFSLLHEMNVQDAVAAFDRAEAESLAVVDKADTRRVIGVLTEAPALRRAAKICPIVFASRRAD